MLQLYGSPSCNIPGSNSGAFSCEEHQYSHRAVRLWSWEGGAREIQRRYHAPLEIIGESESVESELRRILVKRDSSFSTIGKLKYLLSVRG